MWIPSGNGFASVKSQGCLCREVVKISVSAEPRSTNGHEGENFDKRPVLALELFIPEGRYRILAPLTPPGKTEFEGVYRAFIVVPALVPIRRARLGGNGNLYHFTAEAPLGFCRGEPIS